MDTPAPAARLEAIVKERARELRGEGVGYTDAVTALADELFRTERGKEARIGELGATPGLVGPRIAASEPDDTLFGKSKKARARALGLIAALVSPWVSDVYEEG